MSINYKFMNTLLLTSLFVNPLSASTFPRGCEVRGFGFQQNFLILNDKGQQAFYMVQNRSNKAIELEHVETKDVFMSPKLHSKLDAGQWAAFASDIQDLYFKCYIQNGEDTMTLNCNEVLDICQYPRAKFALSNMGNYWVSTNKSQLQVIKDAAAKGIYLRW